MERDLDGLFARFLDFRMRETRILAGKNPPTRIIKQCMKVGIMVRTSHCFIWMVDHPDITNIFYLYFFKS